MTYRFRRRQWRTDRRRVGPQLLRQPPALGRPPVDHPRSRPSRCARALASPVPRDLTTCALLPRADACQYAAIPCRLRHTRFDFGPSDTLPAAGSALARLCSGRTAAHLVQAGAVLRFERSWGWRCRADRVGEQNEHPSFLGATPARFPRISIHRSAFYREYVRSVSRLSRFGEKLTSTPAS